MIDVAALYRSERVRVLRIFRSRRDAEDLVHDVFVEALRGASAFRGEASPSTWVYRIATTTLLMRLRSERSRARRAPLAFDDPEPVERPDELFERAEERDILGRRFDRLTPERRDVVLLLAQGLEHPAIAANLGIPIGTVRSRLFYARRQLTNAV